VLSEEDEEEEGGGGRESDAKTCSVLQLLTCSQINHTVLHISTAM
jgi:hypothetical protein